MTETKRCRGCGEDRRTEDFRWVRKTGHNPYRQSRCRACDRKTDYDHGAAVAEARSRCSDPELLRWPATAADARRLGVNKFFNGVPCINGHVGPRRAKNSNCIRCELERTKATAKRKTREAQQRREEKRQEAWGGDCPWPATRREAQRIGAKYYFTNKACVNGHIQVRETASERCTDCPRPDGRQRHRQRMVEEGTEVVLAEQAEASRKSYWRDPDKQRRRQRDRRAIGVASAKSQRLRTPPWQTAEEAAAIDAFYDACPPGHEVDHIVRIDHRGRLVGGLHVLSNLQYLTPRQNTLKERQPAPSREEAAAAVSRGDAVWSEHIDARGNVMWTHYSNHGQRVADGGWRNHKVLPAS